MGVKGPREAELQACRRRRWATAEHPGIYPAWSPAQYGTLREHTGKLLLKTICRGSWKTSARKFGTYDGSGNKSPAKERVRDEEPATDPRSLT